MKQTTNFTYFKVTFLAITAGLTAASITKGLFDIDFSDLEAINKLIFKSLVLGVIVGIFMGLLNMYFKVGPFKKQTD